jgi:hypothetical protein
MKSSEIIFGISLFLSSMLTVGQVRLPNSNGYHAPINTNSYYNVPRVPNVNILEREQQQQRIQLQNQQIIQEVQ